MITTSSCGQQACAKSTEDPLAHKNKEYLASTQQKEIESKTEELFHLIAKMDRELPSHCSRDNRQLLMHLSILVQPKPDDPQWYNNPKGAHTHTHMLNLSVLFWCWFYDSFYLI